MKKRLTSRFLFLAITFILLCMVICIAIIIRTMIHVKQYYSKLSVNTEQGLLLKQENATLMKEMKRTGAFYWNQKDLPQSCKFVRSLKPQFVSIQRCEDNVFETDIEILGGFFHCGFVVCSSDTQSDTNHVPIRGIDWTVKQITSGVWIYKE